MIVTEEAFIEWSEDNEFEIYGKSTAVIQTNSFLNWIRNQMEENNCTDESEEEIAIIDIDTSLNIISNLIPSNNFTLKNGILISNNNTNNMCNAKLEKRERREKKVAERRLVQ